MLKDGFRIYVYLIVCNGEKHTLESDKKIDYAKFYEYHKNKGNKVFIKLLDSYMWN